MSFRRYFGYSLILLSFCIIIFALVSANFEDNNSRTAVLVGIAIGYINSLIAFGWTAWGFTKSHRHFFIAVFGSIIFRFLLIFALLFVLIWALKLSKVALIFSLVVTYFLFLGLEIWQIYLHAGNERITE